MIVKYFFFVLGSATYKHLSFSNVSVRSMWSRIELEKNKRQRKTNILLYVLKESLSIKWVKDMQLTHTHHLHHHAEIAKGNRIHTFAAVTHLVHIFQFNSLSWALFIYPFIRSICSVFSSDLYRFACTFDRIFSALFIPIKIDPMWMMFNFARDKKNNITWKHREGVYVYYYLIFRILFAFIYNCFFGFCKKLL